MRKMRVKEAVRMMLRAFMLMNVLKGRLEERKRQHEVHQYGNARSHNPYRTLSTTGLVVLSICLSCTRVATPL